MRTITEHARNKAVATGIAAAIILTVVSIVGAQSAVETTAAEVRHLVSQLADQDPRVRRAAEARIVELGPDALVHLPIPGPRAPAEVRTRLMRIRRQLEQLDAVSLVRPSVVALQGSLSLEEAAAQLESQSSNRIVDARRAPIDTAAITFDLPEATFWQAMARLMELSKTELSRNRLQPSALVLSEQEQLPDSWTHRSATQNGLFRIEAVQVSALHRNPQATDWRITLAIWWEPRVTPVCLKHRLGQLQYQVNPTDEIIHGGTEAAPEVLIQSQTPFAETTVTLANVPNSAKRVASLAGEMEAALLGRESEFIFSAASLTLPAGSAALRIHDSQQHADVTVAVQDVQRRGRLWDVQLAVAFDRRGTAFESHRGWVFSNLAYLRDPQGATVKPEGMETLTQQESRYVLSYRFGVASLAGYQFVYRTPTTVIDVPIHYHLQDIPLP